MAGLWISAVTLAPFGIVAVPIVIFIAWDLRGGLTAPSPETVAVRRVASDTRVLRGEPLRLEVSLENKGPDVKALLVRDFLPKGTRLVRGSTSMVCSLKRGEKARLRYEVAFDDPGEFGFYDLVATSASSFGLWERSAVLTAPLSVRVYPRRAAREAQTTRARAFAWTGTTASKYRGGRVEFMDIRAYSPGDPLKSVNWRASARSGGILVNEWQADRGLDCIVIVDLSPRNLPRVGWWSARTAVIGASYELAGVLIDGGNRVGMLIMGDVLHKVRPGFGSRHLRLMAENLVDSREGEVWSLGHAESFLELFFHRQYSNRGGTLFFVMAGPDEVALDTVTALSRRGFSCNSVLVNTLDEETAILKGGRSVGAKSVEFGRRFAKAEMDAYRVAFARVSSVYEWTDAAGFSKSRAILAR